MIIRHRHKLICRCLKFAIFSSRTIKADVYHNSKRTSSALSMAVSARSRTVLSYWISPSDSAFAFECRSSWVRLGFALWNGPRSLPFQPCHVRCINYARRSFSVVEKPLSEATGKRDCIYIAGASWIPSHKNIKWMKVFCIFVKLGFETGYDILRVLASISFIITMNPKGNAVERDFL